MDPALAELVAGGSPDDEVAVLVRLTAPTAVPPAIRLVAQFGNIATCRIKRGDIESARASAQVASMKAARFYGPSDLPDEADDTADLVDDIADAAESNPIEPAEADVRRPEGASWPTGAGVAIGHIDWGIDVAHPAFRRPDGSTRVVALWDQRGGADAERPNRYGYGRVFNRDDIDRALASGDPYAALGYRPSDFDTGTGTHGAHTTSISAGTTTGTLPAGVAPEADIVFVHLSTYTAEGPTDLGDSVAYCEAIDFILRTVGSPRLALPAEDAVLEDAERESRPAYRGVVVNSSLGRHGGPHVGSTLVEQALDAALREAPGRAFVHSAGNYFDRRAHASGTLRPGETHRLRFVVGPRRGGSATRAPTEVELWYPGTDRLSITVVTADNRIVGPVAGDNHLPVETAGSAGGPVEIGRLYHRLKDPNNGDNEAVLFLDRGTPAGVYELVLEATDVADGRYHVWIERNNAGKREQAEFQATDSDPETTTGTICNGFRTIAVGAYDARAWLEGGDVPGTGRPLGSFSSSGPTRDGRQKPDLCAPGVRVLGARSRPRQWAGMAEGEPPALTTRMSGTSMAAPHVTGTIALMFAAAARPLAIEETRRMLLAATDPLPLDAPASARRRVGSGFLNTGAAVEAARVFTDPGRRVVAPVSSSGSTTTQISVPEVAAMSPYESIPAEDVGTAGEDEGFYPEYYPDLLEAEPVSDATVAVEAFDERSTERSSHTSYDRRPSLPISFVVPLGGGGIAPALSVPFGGAGSPLSLAVPLGSTPAPMPTAVLPVAVPLAPVAADPPVAVAEPAGALDLGADADERFGQRLVAVAESVAADTGLDDLGSSGSLRRILRAVGQEAGLSPLGSAHRPTATELFNAFVGSNATPARAKMAEHYGRAFECIGRPGQAMPTAGVRAGDLFIRVAPGEGWGAIGVVSGPESAADSGANASATNDSSGVYLPVIDLGPGAGASDGSKAKRVADSGGVVLPDTMLLRLRAGTSATSEARDQTAPAGGAPTGPVLAKGASGPTVRSLQANLNRFSSAEERAGRLALEGCPLPLDGKFGDATEDAVRDLQMRAFPDDASQWNGVVGPATRAKIEAVPSAAGTEAPAAPAQRSTFGSGLFGSGLFGRPAGPATGSAESDWTESTDHTADLSDTFFVGMHAVGAAIRTTPEFLLAVMNSESGIRANAHNPNGHASGLIQFMPKTLERLGWTQGHEAFRQLTAEQQLPFVEAFYRPFVNQGLNSTARLYQATFLPATLKRGSNPDTVIVDKNANDNVLAYEPNKGFDRRGDGRILVGDLSAFVERAKRSARWREAKDRLAAAAAGPIVPPVPPSPPIVPPVPPVPPIVPPVPPAPPVPTIAHPVLRRGARGDSVREAQVKLNAVHARAIAASTPGLADCPLGVDGVFGVHTYNAVVSFQQRVFATEPKEWDGVIGKKTWAQLDAAAAASQPTPFGLTITPSRAEIALVDAQEAELAEVEAGFAEQAAPVNWCQLRTAIANAAQAELQRWRRPNGTAFVEGDAAMLPILAQYWGAVPGFGDPTTALDAARRSAADDPDFPWSAAFICFVMRSAGVQAAHGFAFSGRHISYIVGALRNRERSDRNRGFWLTDHVEIQAEATPEPGDLLCFNRCCRRPGAPARPPCPAGQAMTTHSYASLRREFWETSPDASPSGCSHTAIVVGTTTRGGSRFVQTIGGNEDNSVRLRENVLLNAAGGIDNPAGRRIFGMIKIVGC